MSETTPLLEVRNLVKHFGITRGVFGRTTGAVQAVDGISLSIARGETVGLVGSPAAASPRPVAPSCSCTGRRPAKCCSRGGISPSSATATCG